jgi:predicted RecB family nuclease
VRLYHYGHVEPMYLERLLGGSADDLLRVATDLLSVVRAHYFSGLGYSLKRLAPLAGFQCADDGITGADTYDLIARARTGEHAAWEKLVRYNEDDTRALKALRWHLVAGAAAE